MRIIAGKYRSRPLHALGGMDVRPTSDRLRETLFNVLVSARGGSLEGTVWIDLFAGTGAVGIEALSRGATQVYFVESSKKAARVISDNLRSLGITDGHEVLEREAVPALRGLEAQAAQCDICFLDPPYRMAGAYEQTLNFLAGSQLIGPSSIVVAEHDKRFDPGEQFGALRRFRRLEQGDGALSFYRRTDESLNG